jgi:acyl-CoA synthetase (AMP-forming)/AMP-acid ligase II
MSDTGDVLTYGAMERRANQGAQLFRNLGIQTGDTIAVWLPNIPEYLCIYWAAQRAGLYITPIATALTTEEADYIVENSSAKLLISCNDIAGLAGLLSEQRPSNLQHYFDHSHCRDAEYPNRRRKCRLSYGLFERHDRASKRNSPTADRWQPYCAAHARRTVGAQLWRGA